MVNRAACSRNSTFTASRRTPLRTRQSNSGVAKLLRPAVTLPVDLYSDKRIREFNRTEADLDQALRRKKRAR